MEKHISHVKGKSDWSKELPWVHMMFSFQVQFKPLLHITQKILYILPIRESFKKVVCTALTSLVQCEELSMVLDEL